MKIKKISESLDKPVPKVRKPCLVWDEVMGYMEKKYKIDGSEYWSWLVNPDNGPFQSVTNGSEDFLPVLGILGEDDDFDFQSPDWVVQITRHIYDEFEEHIEDGGIFFYISW